MAGSAGTWQQKPAPSHFCALLSVLAHAVDPRDVAIAIMQWSGADEQKVSIPWTRVRTTIDAPPCARQFIDISGDGTPNDETNVSFARVSAALAGVPINVIAIELLGLTITGFYNSRIITPEGFCHGGAHAPRISDGNLGKDFT